MSAKHIDKEIKITYTFSFSKEKINSSGWWEKNS
jgi:hypothetical protein